MSTITEKRQKLLSEKLQEMGDIGVSKRSAEDSPFFDRPVELEQAEIAPMLSEEMEEPREEPPTHTDTKKKSERSNGGLSFKEYEARFFAPSRDARGKVGFTIHWEVLQTLRDVLNDVRSRATLTSYIENIIIEHLREHRAMLNKAASQNKRCPTINLDL